MASRRIIKKSVKNLTSDLLFECIVYKNFHLNKDHTKTNDIMHAIVTQHNELIKKVNCPKANDDRKKTKAAYKEVTVGLQNMITKLDGLK